MNGADLNDVPGLGRMDHLAATNVDPAVSRFDADVPGLWIAHPRPGNKIRRRPSVTISSGQSEADKSRAVIAVRTGCRPFIRFAKRAVRTGNDRTAYHGIIIRRIRCVAFIRSICIIAFRLSGIVRTVLIILPVRSCLCFLLLLFFCCSCSLCCCSGSSQLLPGSCRPDPKSHPALKQS